MRAGQLRERFSFEERSSVSDGYGNTREAWTAQFVVAGRRVVLRGGETVMAARLQGTDPAIITIRASVAAHTIRPHWRAVDVRTNEIWAIRSVNPAERKDHIDLLVERGVEA